MLDLKDAAEYLGCSTKTIRRAVDRTRERAMGGRVDGPMIKFFQPRKNSPIRFRQEWLDEFVEQNSISPITTPAAVAPAKPKRPKTVTAADYKDYF